MPLSVSKNKYKKVKVTNQDKQILVIDWLTLNVNDVFKHLEFDENDQFIYGSWVISLEEGRTRNFDKRAFVYSDGVRVATLTFQSSSPTVLVDQAHIKFENFLFYSGQIRHYATTFVRDFHISDVKISRLDIACDGVFFHPFLNEFLYGSKNTKKRHAVQLARYKDVDNINPVGFNRSNLAERTFDSFFIGSVGRKTANKKRGEKVARYYNKTAEIAAKGDKDYISEFHLVNSLVGDVYRYEVQLSSSYISKLAEFEWLDIFDSYCLQSLFLTANKSFFEFYYTEFPSVAKCPRVDLFPSLSGSYYTTVKRVVKDSTRTTKITIKKLITDLYVGAFKDSRFEIRNELAERIIDLLNVYDLHEWYASRSNFIYSKIQRTARERNIPLYGTILKIF